MNELEKKLNVLCKEFNLSIDDNQFKNLLIYINYVMEIGLKQNLVSKARLSFFIEDQIADAFTLANVLDDYCPVVPIDTFNLVDIGTGAGLPGLVLAILRPDFKVTLLDSNQKKIKFLNLVVNDLTIPNKPKVILGRAEETAHDLAYRDKFDLATIRAVASLKISIELALPFLKVNGLFLGQKSAIKLDDEIVESQDIMDVLYVKQMSIKDAYADPSVKQHKIIVLSKTKSTPKMYPRKWKNIITP